MKHLTFLTQTFPYNFTAFDYEQMREHQLNWTEYMLIDVIDHLSKGNINKYCPGWCYASKETLADIIGISKSQVNRVLAELVDNWKIERDNHGHYKTLIKWNRITKYDNLDGKKYCYVNHLIRRDAGFSVQEMVVYQVAWNLRQNKKDSTPLTRINKARLSKNLGISRQQIYRILAHLEKHGWLGSYSSNDIYMLDFGKQNCDCKKGKTPQVSKAPIFLVN